MSVTTHSRAYYTTQNMNNSLNKNLRHKSNSNDDQGGQ